LVKRAMRAIRISRGKEPRVFERLAHPPGAEAQFGFGELARVVRATDCTYHVRIPGAR
jgi:hypothetical protein